MTEHLAPDALLLELLSPQAPMAASAIAELGSDAWQRILGAVRQHRLAPLLHWNLAKLQPDLRVPDDVRHELAASFRQATARALLLQRELVQIHRILTQAAIPYQALKGAFLAFHAYPHPALRPLRDLDILVPRSQAIQAFETLLAAGMTPAEGDVWKGDLATQICLKNHLTPLQSAGGRVQIEVHASLSMPIAVEPGARDLGDDPGYWERGITRQVAGETLCFPAPTDLLLHLITHATLHHRLDNGPLILSDIAYLIRLGTVDWISFWQRAKSCGGSRASWLMLRLAERYWGSLEIIWPASPEPLDGQEQAEVAALALMLRDPSTSRELNIINTLTRQGTATARVGELWQRLFPSRSRMIAEYPVRPGSSYLYVYVLYARRLWRLLSRRMPEFLGARRSERFDHDLEQLTVLDRWLGKTCNTP